MAATRCNSIFCDAPEGFFHFSFMPIAQRFPVSHSGCGAESTLKSTARNRKNKMKQFLKITAAPATALFAMAFVAMATPAAASPIDYCRNDVTSGMRGCRYASLEQCKATSSGRGGSCYADAFSRDGSSSGYA